MIGGTACTPAAITEYPAAGSTVVRTVVTDIASGAPISGATVVGEGAASCTGGGTAASGTTTCTSDTNGVVSFTGMTSPYTISVFNPQYSYVTVMGVTANDILIPIKASSATGAPGQPGAFNGTLTSADFANVSNELGTLHLDISGASIGGNLIDLSLTTLLGPSQPITISLGTATSYGPFNLPEGIALGLGPTMFGAGAGGAYGIEADPGFRALWSLGGNAVIGDVLQAIGPVLSGGTGSISSEIPTILTAILPIVGTLESAVTSGVLVTPGETSTLTYGTAPAPALELDTLLRLHLNVKTPVLADCSSGTCTTYTDNAGKVAAFDGAVILGGVLATPEGFVPLGLTAGVDSVNATGAMTADGLTDPATTGAPEQQLPLRVASRHGGIETAPWAFVTLGASLADLVGGLGGGSGGGGTVLAGNVTFVPKIEYNNGANADIDLSQPFLTIPEGASFTPRSSTVTTATFTPPTAATPASGAPSATFHRLDIGSGVEWYIYFPASLDGSGPQTIPAVPSGFTDLAATPSGGTAPGAALDTVSLGYSVPSADVALGTACTSDCLDYNGVVQFQGINLDNLTLETNAFAVRDL
jgi:hypothetical protein